MGLVSPKTTTIILHIEDIFDSRPVRVVEDVLVQVGSLVFLVCFMVLNCVTDPEVPLILGRPFVEIGWVLIDIAIGKLTIRAHDKI